jgi:carbamoyl-phosphate synthase large subunit
MTNVLLTSAGRRNYMVDYFRAALKPYGGKVFAINSSLDAAALWVADAFDQCPLIYDPAYASFLLDYCKKNKISLVISLFDIELPVLSGLKQDFAENGITIVVADKWFTDMANDKWKTQDFLRKNGFPTVPTFLDAADFAEAESRGEVDFPVFVKPRWGMGSLALFRALNFDDLAFYIKKAREGIDSSYLKYESGADLDHAVMIQPNLPGDEFGLDIINDLGGNYQTTVVKRKVAMRAGETDVAVTEDQPVLEALGRKLSGISKHPGNMDIDVFFDGQTPYILELNPRFGGGYPFSHEAGINLPEAIVKWFRKEPVDAKQLLNAKIGVRSMKGMSIIGAKQ